MSITSSILRTAGSAALLAIAHTAMAQGAIAPMSITATADSTILIMGDRTIVNVEVVKNGHQGVLLTRPLIGKDYYGLDLVDEANDSTDLGNDRIQLNYRFTFQAFDPNDLLTIPAFEYAANGDTVKSESLTFKVLPVELSPELGDPADIDNLGIHPDETVVSIKLHWYDYIPDWSIWLLIALALVGLIITVLILYKRNGPGIFVPRKPIPPHQLALENLEKLKKKGLIDKGLAKQFFTEVTDIWRTYLEGRFGISAMEMTSRQILTQLRANQETHLTAKDMEEILQISDFVKFAALNPSRDDMLQAYNTIYQFVESTKPMPEPDEANDGKSIIKEPNIKGK